MTEREQIAIAALKTMAEWDTMPPPDINGVGVVIDEATYYELRGIWERNREIARLARATLAKMDVEFTMTNAYTLDADTRAPQNGGGE